MSWSCARGGETHFFGPEALPVTHALRNTGSSEISVVIVELLNQEESHS